MQRIVTHFGNAEFKGLVVYRKRKKMSLCALANGAIREYVKKHP